MINEHTPIYLCSFKKEFDNKISFEGTSLNHNYGKINGRPIFLPKNIDAKTINPKNFIELKKQFKLNELLIIDRLIGSKETVSIINHVNRSGQNFLRGVTPEEKFPQFPDMSKVYNMVSGLKTIVVHTIGTERFKSPPIDEKAIWSEAVGLIAPVAHYVGIKIFAIGGSNVKDIIKLL